MGSYIPNTAKEQEKMLKEIGYKDFNDMFSCIPMEDRLKEPLNLPSGLSEMQVIKKMTEISQKNKVYSNIFRGAGAYNHYIPSIVKSVASKEEFLTTYTPYQAEISQGILQSIFEFQTMICQLTGMDVANASHYDGATAAAEAITMCRDRKRKNAYVSEAVHPSILQVMKTYCFASNTKLIEIPCIDGLTDLHILEDMLGEDSEAACVYIQQPNFYGNFEDAEGIGEITHAAKAKFIMGINPISIAISKSPGEYGADIAVGDGQPLGIPLSYGGPYVGFMATTEKMMRKLPGRIVGETIDADGKRCFVLTLQAREQHIRREKASSNICSNQDLCTLIASAYMASMGEQGLKEVAYQSMSKAHYLANELENMGFNPVYRHNFFNEFITEVPCGSTKLLKALKSHGILGGLPLTENLILWCTTEMNSKQDIDMLVKISKAVLEGKEAHQ